MEYRLARKKPVIINYMTFDDIAGDIRPIRPDRWSHTINGHHMTHQNDKLYVIETLEGDMNMTHLDVLIIGVQGEIYPCKIDIFEKTYDKIV